MRLLIPLLALELLSVKGFAASQTISINPDKRLKAVISSDSMNRLAVANDRITQIFGDHDAYEVQTEESTGQAFLKPTLENGKKPLAITLITENGLTQDMTLEPVERDAATVILKSTTPPSSEAANGLVANTHSSSFQPSGQGFAGPSLNCFGQQMPGFGAALGFQDQVIVAMKFLVSGSAPTIGIDSFDRKGPKGIEIGLIEAVNLGNFKGYKLDVKNVGDVPMDILEK
ncbi:MAG: TraK domain-containing protein, partial [Legionellaceae bacterium]